MVRGWAIRDIAAAAGLSGRTVGLIRSGKLVAVMPATVAALNTVQGSPPPGQPHRNLTIPPQVLRHLKQLVAAGWTARGIAAATGVTTESISGYVRGVKTSIQQRTVDAILTIPVQPPTLSDRERVLVSKEFHEHIGRLLDAGWQVKQIANAAGVTYSVLLKVHTGRMTTLQAGMLTRLMAVTGAPPVRAYAGLHEVDPRVPEHLRDLISLGWTHENIAAAAGVKVNVVSRLLRGESTQYRAGVGQALLAVTGSPPRIDSPGDLLDAAPVRAHVQRLLAEPANTVEIARAAGVSHHSVSRILDPKVHRVRRATAERLLAVSSARTGAALIPAGTVRNHLKRLRRAGVTFADMERASGVEQSTLRELVSGERTRVGVDLRDWLLQLNVKRHGLVTDTQRARRYQQAREAAHEFLAHGYTVRFLAQVTGIRRGTLSPFLTGTRKQIAPALLDRLERVVQGPVPPPGPETLISPVASIRRVQAMIALGWPIDELADRCGVRLLRRLVTRWPASQPIRLGDAQAIEQLAKQVQSRRGPSPKTAAWGARMGWLVPAWWDESTIGSIDGYPDRHLLPRSIVAARRDRIADLVALGHDTASIADVLLLPVHLVSQDRGVVARRAA